MAMTGTAAAFAPLQSVDIAPDVSPNCTRNLASSSVESPAFFCKYSKALFAVAAA